MASPVEIIIASYENALEADRAYEQLEQRHSKGDLYLIDAAVLVKDLDNRTSIKEVHDPRGGAGSKSGAAVGGLVGLFGGSVIGPLGSAFGALLGMGVGAATGGATAELMDSGLEDDQLQKILDRMKKGTSALVVVVDHTQVPPALAVMDAYEAKIGRYGVNLAITGPIEDENTDETS